MDAQSLTVSDRTITVVVGERLPCSRLPNHRACETGDLHGDGRSATLGMVVEGMPPVNVLGSLTRRS